MPSFRLRSAVLVPALSLILTSQAWAQKTIHVPADQPTIQAGIDAAATGDTVLVAPGTYYENIDFKGKSITVTSSDGAAKTILDGGGNDTAVTFKSGEPRAAVLSNLTITHGGMGRKQANYGDDGSGVLISSSAPTILNNIITQNYCQNVSSIESAPLIQGNVISSSLNPEACFVLLTGGIYIGGNLDASSAAASDGRSPLIIGNTIENNTTGQGGDGGGDGGPGIAVWGGSPLIEGNIIRNNKTISGSGGAVNVVYGDSIAIVQNLIYGNSAGCGGGAFSSEMGGLGSTIYLLIANNTIFDDSGSPGGGYSDCRKTSEVFTHFYDGGGPTIKFVNNIFDANSAPGLDCGELNSQADEAHQSLFDHNLLYDTDGTFFASNCFDASKLHGNLVADPKFADASGHDFHLTAGSPAIDAGNGSVLAMLNTLSGVNLTRDFEGNVREQDASGKGHPIIDMGAYEFSGVANAAPTRIVLSSSAYYGPANSNFTLIATLSSALGVPTGAVVFFMDDVQIGSSIIAGGVATLNNVTIKPGVHVLYATYDLQGGFQPAISVVVVVDIDRYSTTLTMTSAPNPSLVGQAVQFSLTTASADTAYVPSPIQLYDSFTNSTLATLMPDASGNASFSTSTLALGGHDITASYAGDSLHASNNTSVFQQVISGYSTTTTLNAAPNPSNHNQSVSFTAHVTSSTGTPTGTVTFTDGASTVIGSAPLDQAGNATVSTAALTVGNHTITASFSSTGTYAASSASVLQQVNGLSTKALLTVTPATIQAGDSVTLTANVTDLSGTGTPTGTVTFLDGGTALGTSMLTVAGATSITTTTLSPGAHSLSCTYSGDSVYSPANCAPVPFTVQTADTTTTLVSSGNPTPALTPVTFTANLTSRGKPNSGPVQFSLDGNPVQGGTAGAAGTTSIQLALPVGTHTVAAHFAGSTGYNASSATVTETATQNPTATTLGAPPAPVYQNQSFSLGFSVKALTGTAQPYGTIVLLDGATAIATQSIAPAPNNPVYNFNFSVAPLAPGTHLLSAVYTPADGNFAASSSGQIAAVVLPQTFTFTAAEPAMTIETEHHGSMALTLTSVGGWTGPVQLSCVAPLPPVLTCELTPRVALAANASVSTALTLETDAVINFKSGLDRPAGYSRHGGAGLVVFAGLLPIALSGLRRRQLRIKGRLSLLIVALVCFGTLAALTGCSGKYPAHTPPGTYDINLTATGTAVGASAPSVQSIQVTLVVKP